MPAPFVKENHMAKNSVGDWDTTAANNTDVGGIDIAENCAAANINNAIREIMAQLATLDPVSVATGNFTANIQITASSPTITLNDSDTSVAANITSNNAGGLRLRADPSNVGASSNITLEVDGTVLGTVDSGGFNGVIGGTTPAAGTFSEVTATSGLI